jgi:hypothetical protein
MFLKKLIDKAMQLIPNSITVGVQQFSISRVNYTQKLVLGGSLTTNLLEAIAISSNGEFELAVEYEKALIEPPLV